MTTNTWIDAREQTPSLNKHGNSDRVLVIVIGSVYEGEFRPYEDQIGLGQCHENGKWSVTGVSYIGYPVVSHWMPLPTLPDREQMRQWS